MACKYCDFEKSTLPWFQTINEVLDDVYDGINVDDNGMPSLYLFGANDGYGYDEAMIPIYYCPFCGRKLADLPNSEVVE